MGYLIQFAVREGMLRAVVSGKTTDRAGGRHERRIASDIAEEAGRQTVSRVLINLRGVADRTGSLGVLSMARCEPARIGGLRVAVVDTAENDAYYALHEMAALARGCVLRCFSTAADAVRWLRSVPSHA